MRRILRAYPTMLRIGLAEAVAYRAEFVIWMLTTTMPLVMLALWTAVARDAPFGNFGQKDFVAYYLGMLVVRTLTGSWVVWEINGEIRSGTLSMRLLRPIHPIIAYSAEHLAAVPLRAAIALPIALGLLAATQGDRIVSDPVIAATIPLVIAGAWMLTFLAMFMIGTLGMFMDKSIAVFEVWWGMQAVLSGYLVPLALMPTWLRNVADWLPFRYMLEFPVQVLTGMTTRAEALGDLAVQWGFVGVFLVGALALWRVGVKRFEAFGG